MPKVMFLHRRYHDPDRGWEYSQVRVRLPAPWW